ncbi:transcriptional regulator, LacI family [Novosphingobium sp. B1]|nr:transcriptional regulator, LacI family [Novosphingobium sp. B1]
MFNQRRAFPISMSMSENGRAGEHATMDDVARLAGVSLKSVSRVINAEPHVSARLREKVEAAISALNYVPDTAARSLAGSRTFIVGLLFDNPSPNYTMNIQKGVYEACRANQYHLRIDNVDSSAPRAEYEARLLGLVSNSRCDGFILTPPLTDDVVLLDFLDRSGIRYVRISPALQAQRSPSVCIDDAQAAASLARHLWELGHRKLAVVLGPERHLAAARRRDGFIAALAELGLPEPVREVPGNFSFEGGIRAGTELLQDGPRPTAIFATNDDSAAGVMAACAQAGLRVPADISVAGFDDSWIARSVWPYLTTVNQPIEEMGYAAASLLLRKGEPQNTPHLLDYSLVVRDSTAAPLRA